MQTGRTLHGGAHRPASTDREGGTPMTPLYAAAWVPDTLHRQNHRQPPLASATSLALLRRWWDAGNLYELSCFLAALLFPNAELTHNWLSLYSTRPMGSVGQLIEGVIWNAVFAWIAAVIFGVVYNSLAPKT